MRLHGEWSAALDEFELASRRYEQVGSPDAAGLAAYEAGDVHRLRGEWDRGRRRLPARRRPRLRPAARPRAAVAGARPDRGGPRRDRPAAGRARRAGPALPAAARRGRGAASRPATSTGPGRPPPSSPRWPSPSGAWRWRRWPPRRRGAVELAAGDASGALPYLRKAHQLWTRAESPFERARAQVLIGRALAAVGDAGVVASRARGGPLDVPPARRPARRRRGLALLAPPASPPASPPARSRSSAWSPPAAATPRSPPTWC